MKNYIFYVNLPLMEDNFYFRAEDTIMREPPIANKELEEGKVVCVNRITDELNIKQYNNSSTKLVLDELKQFENEKYTNCKQKIDKLFFHYHNLFEVSIIMEGNGYYFVNGKALEVKKGSVVVFNKLVPHAWIEGEDGAPIQRTFSFYPTLLLSKELEGEENIFIKECLDNITYIHIDEYNSRSVLELFEEIYVEYKNKALGYKKVIKDLLIKFFIDEARKENKDLNIDKKKHKPVSIEIESAIEYMKSNFQQNITLDDVAKHIYMHPNYFSSLFKKKCNVSFANYMNILKMSMATELMQSTNLHIDDLAYKCGFSSISNFYKVFKETYGITPMNYMKNF